MNANYLTPKHQRNRQTTWCIADRWITVSLVILTSCLVQVANGAPQPINKPGPAARETSTKPRTDIYLNDNLEARDLIRRARKLATKGAWPEAAKLLHEAATKHGDALIRHNHGVYVGIREYVQQLIGGWPKDGIRAYRELFEDQARRELGRVADSNDVVALLSVYDRYFCTSLAPELADKIGQLAIEAGELALAEQVYSRLLTFHPDASSVSDRFRPTWLIIRAALGEKIDPHALAGLKIRWQGEDRPVGDVIAGWSRQIFLANQQSQANAWPTFDGNIERSRSELCQVDELGLLWRFGRFFPGDQHKNNDVDMDTMPSKEGGKRAQSMFPVTQGDLIFVQQGRQIVAIRRSTGAASWRFRFTDEPATFEEDLDDSPAPWDSVTVSNGRVFAALASDQLSYYAYQSPTAPPELICLDADTGKIRWQINGPALADSFAELTFDSSPVVIGDRVLIVGRRRRSFGFEDAYLFAFRTSDGSELFRTHLGGASVGTFGSRRPTASIIAAHGASVYVCTNLGSVASVSLYTGQVSWLMLYQAGGKEQDADSGSSRQMPSWHYNPVIWHDDKLLIKPTDANAVLAIDAKTGSLEYQIEMKDDPRVQLLGTIDNKLFIVGHEVKAYTLDQGLLDWSASLPDDSQIMGRAALASQRLYVPTSLGLSMYAVANGSRNDVGWPTGQEPGNLLALSEQLIVAGSSTLSVYVRKTDLWQRLRTRMADAANDPVPALEFAEVALRGGDLDKALKLFYEALDRAGDLSNPIEANLSRRIFFDAQAFAQAISKREKIDTTALHKLLLCASQCVRDEQSSIVYRISFAQRFVKANKPAVAVRLYHQLLRDRSLRDQAVPIQVRSHIDGEHSTVGILAQSRIASLLEKYPRTIYEPFDAEAETWLDAGQQAMDEAKLQRVLQVFPNSYSAPKAMVALGNMAIEQPGRAAEGARLLAQAYYRYPKDVNRPKLIRSIADAYEQAHQLEHAYRWLSKAAVEYPDMVLDYKGRRISFRAYRDRLAHVRKLIVPTRPTITPPLQIGFTLELEPSAKMLVPWYRHEPFCDWSTFYVATDATVQAYAANGKPVWPKPLDLKSPAQLLLAAKDVAIFATRTKVMATYTSTGTSAWSYGKQWPPGQEPHDWENVNGFRSHSIEAEHLLSVRDDGMMTLIHWPTGKVLWSRSHQPAPNDLVRLDNHEIVYTVPREEGALVYRISVQAGEPLGTIQTREKRAVDDAFISFNEQLILITSQSISSYDTRIARLRWRTEFVGHIQTSSLYESLDAIYLTEDGRTVIKIGLDDGKTVWESDAIGRRAAHDLTIDKLETNIIVSSEAGVLVLDEIAGTTLWRGLAKPRTHFVERLSVGDYVLAINLLDDLVDEPSTAIFYDLRNASGVVPNDGGILTLGNIQNLISVYAIDGALLIQTDSTIRGWTRKKS